VARDRGERGQRVVGTREGHLARLRGDLAQVPFADLQMPLYNNVDAAKVSTASEARDGLARQVTQAVRWTDVIQHMIADGMRTFVEVGPGNVLTGLTRRIDRNVDRLTVGDCAALEAVRTRLTSAG